MEKINIFERKPFLISLVSQLILGVGIFLRLAHYFENRSFWLDETYQTIRITSRSYDDILRNVEIFPELVRVPLGFDLVEKFFVNLGGNNEFAFRFFPLISSIAALILFSFLVKKYLNPGLQLITVGLFAIAEPLVYYAAEVKQYSTDLLIAIVFILGMNVFLKKKSAGGWIILTLAGAAGLWVSHSVIFVLAGIGVFLLIDTLINKKWGDLIKLSVLGLAWLTSFYFVFKMALEPMVKSTTLLGEWESAFFKGPVLSVESLQWLGGSMLASFNNPVGLGWPYLIAVFFVLGIKEIFRQQKLKSLLIILPIVFVLTAGFLGKYPFRGRLLLFLIPFYYIVIGYGVQWVLGFMQTKKWIGWFIVCGLLFYYPVREASAHLLKGRELTQNRQAMNFLSQNYQAGDFIFLNTSGKFPFWYYVGQLGISKKFLVKPCAIYNGVVHSAVKVGTFARSLIQAPSGLRTMIYQFEYNEYNDNGMFRDSFCENAQRNKVFTVVEGFYRPYPALGRTWVFLSSGDDYDEKANKIIKDSFDSTSKLLQSFTGKNVGVYLYYL
ncbi:MAG: glycosyltransferase family 39 protein [Candidatus Omnitrophica bacterium]|nr:glycosyltransferase family 39 protein [Candidatus Omnitrophota bacterium]